MDDDVSLTITLLVRNIESKTQIEWLRVAGVQSSKLKATMSRDIGWEAFRRSLENRGYFWGLLEGLKEHKKRMDEALDYYKNTTLFSRVK